MDVHGYESEAEFIEDKVRGREERNPGTGKQFRDSWFADRDTVYAPLFLEYINHKIPKKRKFTASVNNPNAKYNLHVQTSWVYPGYNVGFAQPAKIEVTLRLFEISNPRKILWQSKSPTRIQAKVAPYKREVRIGAAYASLAMSMSWLLRRNAK